MIKFFLNLFNLKGNKIRIFLNKIQPTFLKTVLAKYHWSKNDFKKYDNKSRVVKGVVEVDWNHKQKAKNIYDEITSNTKQIKRIMEFGCNYGVNLENFLNNSELEVTGIDINTAVKNLEKKYSNYKGIISDETALQKFEDLHFDVIFTSSVLDHFPDENKVINTIKTLKRKSKEVYLFEPYIEGVCGDVSYFYRSEVEKEYDLKEKLENNDFKFGKNSFLWNYDKYLNDLKFSFTKKKFPLHLSSLGPFYFVYRIK